MTDWQSDLWLIAVIMANIAVFWAVKYLYRARGTRAIRIAELEREVLGLRVSHTVLLETIDALQASLSGYNREKLDNTADIWNDENPPW